MEAVTEKQGKGPESVQRWTAKRRSALVLSILRGETSAQEAARQHGLTVRRDRGVAGAIPGRSGERVAKPAAR